MTKPTIFRLIIVAFGIFIVLLGGVCLYANRRAHRARVDAQNLVAELRGLRVGESTLDDVNIIAARHSRYRSSFLKPAPPACDNREDPCYFDFSYENLMLARLRLAPVIRFGVRIQIYHGRVDAIMVDFMCGTGPSLSGIVVNEGLQPFTERTIEISEASNIRTITIVRLTPNSPERDRVYGLNLKCLDKIGGCPGKSELLPGLLP